MTSAVRTGVSKGSLPLLDGAVCPDLRRLAQRRRDEAERAEKLRSEREAQAAGLLSKTVITIHQRAGEDGKLFGSVGAKEITDALRDARDLRIDKRKVRLDQPLRELGTFMVEIELADGTVAAVKTIISEEK